jgi:hypothetical protein
MAPVHTPDLVHAPLAPVELPPVAAPPPMRVSAAPPAPPPKRSGGGGIPKWAIAAGIVAVLGGAAYILLGRGKAAAPGAAAVPAPPAHQVAAPADTTHRQAADAAAAGVGYIRVIGDLPDEAIIWLDSTQQHGRTFSAAPGSYNLEIETDDFEPWEKQIAVRVRDTTRVRVELVLKSDSSQSR